MNPHASTSPALILAPGDLDPRLADLMIAHGWPGLDHAQPRQTLLALLRYRPAFTIVQVDAPPADALDLIRRINQSSHQSRVIAWDPAPQQPADLEPALRRLGVALYLQSQATHRVTQTILNHNQTPQDADPAAPSPVGRRHAS